MAIIAVTIPADAFTKQGIIAYDCTHKDINITSFSLTGVEPCKSDLNNVTTQEMKVQVLQTKHHFDILVHQCKVVFKREVHHCGMHSHISLYANSYKYILKEFTDSECLKLHQTGSLQVYNELFIREIRRNSTSRGKIYVAGSMEGSTCSGTTYYDGQNTFINAVVSYEYEITLRTSLAVLDTTKDELLFKSGLTCDYRASSCIDSLDGFYTWDHLINLDCSISKFSIIYEGLANKTYGSSPSQGISRAMYTAIAGDRMFSIQSISKYEICGSIGYTTDHAGVYIIETNHIPLNKQNVVTHPQDLDIFTYFNSKITLVEHHIQNQINNLYKHLIYELCNVERSLMEAKLTMARRNPQDFASNFMKKPGYTGVISGEVIYVIECKPVYVTISPMDTCYQEIPVLYNDVRNFISPVTRILQRHGEEIECTPLLMPKYKFGDRWYNFDGRAMEVKQPHTLTSTIDVNWSYDPLPNLMQGGVYDAANVKKMHDMIYDHDDKRAASTIVARSMLDRETNVQDFHPHNLIREDYIETRVKKYWNKLLSISTVFGQFTSSLIGLWLIIKVTKYFLDSFVHGKILYDIYGFSWRLIAAFWDSLAVCLTHRYLYKSSSPPSHSPTEQQTTSPVQDADKASETSEQIYPSLGQRPHVQHQHTSVNISASAPIRRLDF